MSRYNAPPLVAPQRRQRDYIESAKTDVTLAELALKSAVKAQSVLKYANINERDNAKKYIDENASIATLTIVKAAKEINNAKAKAAKANVNTLDKEWTDVSNGINILLEKACDIPPFEIAESITKLNQFRDTQKGSVIYDELKSTNERYKYLIRYCSNPLYIPQDKKNKNIFVLQYLNEKKENVGIMLFCGIDGICLDNFIFYPTLDELIKIVNQRPGATSDDKLLTPFKRTSVDQINGGVSKKLSKHKSRKNRSRKHKSRKNRSRK